ncbi:MAG: membrane dipeptidase, partial [Anaerolineales bacterium]|nr:membrane dipeptidase [Anaerolineales bacterium]
DDQIKAVAENGGVVGLLVHPLVISPENPTVSRAVDHVAYMADLVGIEHVGLGIDLISWILSASGTRAAQALSTQELLESTVRGLEQVGQLPNITAEMLRRGFTPREIRLFLGENMLRVFKEILIR